MDDFLIRKLNEMDTKLDFIKTQVGAVAYVSKHQNREALRDHFWDMMKSAPGFQKVWLAASEYKTAEQIQKDSSIPPGSVGKTLLRMHEKELLHRSEAGPLLRYKRAEPTEGLGLEKLIGLTTSRSGIRVKDI